MRLGKRTVVTIVAVIVLSVATAAIALRIYLGREAESRLNVEDIIDFADRKSAGRSNVFAMCPVDFCTPPGDMLSPVFRMSWERLRDYWREMIAAQKRVERVAWDEKRHRATYIQRSPILRFPDIVTVEFVPLSDEVTTIAIDSRSRYGKGDHDVNRHRVTEWMDLLRQMMRQDQQPSS